MVGMIRKLVGLEDIKHPIDIDRLSYLREQKKFDLLRPLNENILEEHGKRSQDTKRSSATDGLVLYVEIPLSNHEYVKNLEICSKSASGCVTEAPVSSPKKLLKYLSSPLTALTSFSAGKEKHDPLLTFECSDVRKKQVGSMVANSHGSNDSGFQNDNILVSDFEAAEKSKFDTAILGKRTKEIVLRENTYVYKRRKLRNSVLHETSKRSPKKSDTHSQNAVVNHIHLSGISQDKLPEVTNFQKHDKNGCMISDSDVHVNEGHPGCHNHPSRAIQDLIPVDTNYQNEDKNDFLAYDDVDVQSNEDHVAFQSSKTNTEVFSGNNYQENSIFCSEEELCNKLHNIGISTIQPEDISKEFNDCTDSSVSIKILKENSTEQINGTDSDNATVENSVLMPGFCEEKDTGKETGVFSTANELDIGTCGDLVHHKQDEIFFREQFEFASLDFYESYRVRNLDMERHTTIASIVAKYVTVDLSSVNRTVAEHPGLVGDGKSSKKCKICGNSEESASTLICDTCEESFHSYCCYPKISSIPLQDNWYCIACRRKKKTKENWDGLKLQRNSQCKIIDSKHNDEKYVAFLRSLLQDDCQYTTQVRIGKLYQADIPEWSSMIADFAECPYLGTVVSSEAVALEQKLTEENMKKGILPNGWKAAISLPLEFQENWLQCQRVISESDGRKGKKNSICGKWRRAPLSELQNEGWECSCAVLWDPVHADCAVPQELSTEYILRQIKDNKITQLAKMLIHFRESSKRFLRK